MATTTTSFRLKVLLIATTLVVGAFSFIGPIKADDLDRLRGEISAIEAEIASNEAVLNEISARRSTLENKIYSIQVEIDNANNRIELTDKKIAELIIDIKQTEEELERQKGILGESLRELYKRGDITLVELLASSDSYSDFINQQEYLSRLKSAVADSAAAVEALKKELEKEQDEQEILKAELEGQRKILENKRREEEVLLAETRGEEARYQSILADQESQLEAARSQLIAALAASQSNVVFGGTGNYPWSGIEPWTFASCYPDPWGMCKRHCVSYTAWKVNEDYWAGKVRFPMPFWGGVGDAYQWPDNARNLGIPVNSTPKRGSIAVDPYVACTGGGFCYGHVMYVEAVLPNGNIWVSQYNAQGTGVYSEAEVSPAGLSFIHFWEW